MVGWNSGGQGVFTLKRLAEDLRVTAVHNHLLCARPPTFYIHVAVPRDATQLAKQMRVGPEDSKTPFDVKPSEVLVQGNRVKKCVTSASDAESVVIL